MCGGYEGTECDFIGLESVVCIVSIVIDVDKDVYTLVVEDCDLRGFIPSHIDAYTCA